MHRPDFGRMQIFVHRLGGEVDDAPAYVRIKWRDYERIDKNLAAASVGRVRSPISDGMWSGAGTIESGD